jgi:CheY-like chemotaxis protein
LDLVLLDIHMPVMDGLETIRRIRAAGAGWRTIPVIALTADAMREHKLTVFMVTHDLSEGFYLGTRLWVFDKLRRDNQAPTAYGASITYDLPITRNKILIPQSLQTLVEQTKQELSQA